MLDRHIAKGAVVVDDAQLVLALLGVRGKAVRGERVGDFLQRRTQRSLTRTHVVAAQPCRHRLAVFPADFFGHRLGVVARQALECLAQERQHEVVTAHGELHRCGAVDRAVFLCRPPGPGSFDPHHRGLEVATRRELVEVMARHVGVHVEFLGHLRRGRPVFTVANEEVHRTARRVAECRRDGRNLGGECAARHAACRGVVARHAISLRLAS